jgi:hypothetical protein
MQYNAKAKLATLLRKSSIPYQTTYQSLIIGNVSISFFPDQETITFRDNRHPNISFGTHYSHPSTLINKYNTFSAMMNTFIKGHRVFNIPITLN